MNNFNNIDKKWIFIDKNYELLVQRKLPNDKSFSNLSNYINLWNNFENKASIGQQCKEIANIFCEFYSYVNAIKISLFDINNDFDYLKKDWEIFKSKFTRSLEEANKKYEKARNKGNIKRIDEGSKQLREDLSLGKDWMSLDKLIERDTFNPEYRKLTEEEKLMLDQFKFIRNTFYSYLYIKTEQILDFVYRLFNDRQDKLYMFDKYNFIIENNIFGIEFEQQYYDELDTIWKYFKHQTKIDSSKIDYKNHDCMMHYLEIIDSIYKIVDEKLRKLDSFYQDCLDYIDSLEQGAF